MDSGTVFAHGIMSGMEEVATEIRAAARKRARAKEAFERADGELRALLVQARADGIGPSDMARWSGLTREWIAKIAPDPGRRVRKVVAPEDEPPAES